ncbi:MAG TPA: glycoside hydrolase family 88 protein [Bacilli bacterium]|nr:glycoside hydrolase family 88 protein [Bacilli bacterium]
MDEFINKYIESFIKLSKPNKPLWNINSAKYNHSPIWNHVDGCMMTSLLELYKITKKDKYLDFVVDFVEFYVYEDGIIKGFELENFSTTDVSMSRILFDLYKFTSDTKYLKAIEYTRQRILKHPRTNEGNFSHKKTYPHQVSLDDLYMMMPFYIQYEKYLNNKKNYPDILNQFRNVRLRMFNETKKLYHHGYDSTKSVFWANKTTGLSQSFWLRAIGWYIVALIDVIDYLDENDTDEFLTLTTIFKEAIEGILQYQDNETKLFYHVVDMQNRPGNYLETSGSAMIAYALLKGVRLKILDESYRRKGEEIFDGICDNFLQEKNGTLNLVNISSELGLGHEGNLRQDGTFEYYISEPIFENDAIGIAPFIMAYVEKIRK